jgi:hypothetical protein
MVRRAGPGSPPASPPPGRRRLARPASLRSNTTPAAPPGRSDQPCSARSSDSTATPKATGSPISSAAMPNTSATGPRSSSARGSPRSTGGPTTWGPNSIARTATRRRQRTAVARGQRPEPAGNAGASRRAQPGIFSHRHPEAARGLVAGPVSAFASGSPSSQPAPHTRSRQSRRRAGHARLRRMLPVASEDLRSILRPTFLQTGRRWGNGMIHVVHSVSGAERLRPSHVG